jgi:uncharacterized protein YjiS (DUF1127 family)
MAHYSSNRAQSVPFGVRLAEIRDAAVTAYGKWRVYHRTLNELRDLSPRELNDLGINASMIRRIALEAAYGKGV